MTMPIFGNGGKKKKPQQQQPVMERLRSPPDPGAHDSSFYGAREAPVDLDRLEHDMGPQPIKTAIYEPSKIQQIAQLMKSLTYGEKMELVESIRSVDVKDDGSSYLPSTDDLARILHKWATKQLEG